MQGETLKKKVLRIFEIRFLRRILKPGKDNIVRA